MGKYHQYPFNYLSLLYRAKDPAPRAAGRNQQGQPMPSAPSAPDPNLITPLANYFFRTPPDGPIQRRIHRASGCVPPSPSMVRRLRCDQRRPVHSCGAPLRTAGLSADDHCLGRADAKHFCADDTGRAAWSARCATAGLDRRRDSRRMRPAISMLRAPRASRRIHPPCAEGASCVGLRRRGFDAVAV